MTTPRKRIPYSASQLIDQALMELSDLIRNAVNLTKTTTVEEQMKITTRIVDHAYKATIYLKEIRRPNQ